MSLTNLGEVNPDNRGFQELFRDDDGSYIVVSTIGDVIGADLDPGSAALVGLGGLMGQATSGEETMAFRSDADGAITDWGEIAVANGPGSRGEVIEQLGGTAEREGCGGHGYLRGEDPPPPGFSTPVPISIPCPGCPDCNPPEQDEVEVRLSREEADELLTAARNTDAHHVLDEATYEAACSKLRTALEEEGR